MQLPVTDHTILLRPIQERDLDLLLAIYASTRITELRRTGWPEEQQQAFLAFQFHAQHQYYQEMYAGAHFWMIEKNGQPVGRLYVDEDFENRTVRIIDITLLPAWRGLGMGTQLIKDIITFAQKIRRPVSIHVESFNPAMELYQRLGFVLKDITNGVYHLLEWENKEPVLTSL